MILTFSTRENLAQWRRRGACYQSLLPETVLAGRIENTDPMDSPMGHPITYGLKRTYMNVLAFKITFGRHLFAVIFGRISY